LNNNNNKNVLITGAGKRIGLAIAKSLAADNWNIAIHYNNSELQAKKLAKKLQHKHNIKCVCIKANLSNLEELNNIIPAAKKGIGPITCLINNAAIFEYDSINSVSIKSWDLHMNTNIRAPLFLSQSFVQNIPKNTKGNIINIIDQRVLNLTPHFTSYTISKTALLTLTKTLALSLSPYIRVNAIGPGPTIKSKMQSTKEFKEQYKRMPLGIVTSLEEISQFIKFIINSPSLTGQMIALDGGQHLGWAQTNKNNFRED
jgi:NAD(P)-dependent dehydrogenase (short-subunit alcohol dehydrogenase family)